MDSKSPSRATPVQMPDDTTDDWVKPFGCNHVVVNLTPEKNSKAEKDDQSASYDVSPFCVMCGERVAESDTKPSNVPQVEGVKSTRTQTILESSQEFDEAFKERRETKRQYFSPSRRSLSSISQAVQSPDTSCSMHSHKKVKYYCEDHQEICCSVCVNVLHSKCERVMFIKDEINLSWDRKICKVTVDALQNVRMSFEEIVDRNEEIIEQLEAQKKQARNKRELLKLKILDLLDDMERVSERKIEKVMKIAKKQVQANFDSCREVLNDIENSCDLLTEASKSKQPVDIFIATRKMLGQKESYGIALSEAISHTKDITMSFIPETNIENMEHVEKLGEMSFNATVVRFPESVVASVSKIPKTEVRSPRTMKSIFSQTTIPSSISPRQVSLHGKFNVSLADDKTGCENVGATFFPDGRIGIIDMKNSKLKVFDMRFRQGTSLTLSSAPRGICMTSPQEVAITLPDESKIQIVAVTKTPKSIRSFPTDIPCYGITHYNQELIVLCDDGFSMTEVQVLGLTGEVKRIIKMNKTDNVALKNPWYLALNPDGQQICITDRGRLVCMDIEGTIIFEYTDDNLQNARGIAAGPNGHLYVCGTSSNNVHQMSADGSRAKVVISEPDITAPQAICYNADKRLLLLTSVGSETVTIYKLKH